MSSVTYNHKLPDIRNSQSEICHTHPSPTDLLARIGSMNLHAIISEIAQITIDIKEYKFTLNSGYYRPSMQARCDILREITWDKELRNLLRHQRDVLKSNMCTKTPSPPPPPPILRHLPEMLPFDPLDECFDEVVEAIEMKNLKPKDSELSASSQDEVDAPLASNTETPSNSP